MADATSARSDATIPELMDVERYRGLQDKLDVFNAASGGTIVLESKPAWLAANGGEYKTDTRFKQIANLVNQVDEGNPASAIDTLKQEQTVGGSIMQSCRIGPVSMGRDYMMTGKATPAECAANLGQPFQEGQLLKIRDNLLAAAVAAIDSMDTPSACYHVLDVARGAASGAKVTATFSYINQLLAKMYDAREDIRTLVMHSSVFKDLVGDSISNYKMEKVAGVTFVQDVVQAFGRNVLVVDSTSLYSTRTSSYYTDYMVLGLGIDALRATIVADDPIAETLTLDNEVKITQYRGDFDTVYTVRGMLYK
ncbi:MAG: hypothetical protein DRP08_05780, partial [Candidatus Aenigmatarchaeota archaeon]